MAGVGRILFFFAAAHIIYWLTTGLKVGGGGGSDMGRAVRDRIRRDKKGAVFASHMYLYLDIKVDDGYWYVGGKFAVLKHTFFRYL